MYNNFNQLLVAALLALAGNAVNVKLMDDLEIVSIDRVAHCSNKGLAQKRVESGDGCCTLYSEPNQIGNHWDICHLNWPCGPGDENFFSSVISIHDT